MNTRTWCVFGVLAYFHTTLFTIFAGCPMTHQMHFLLIL